MFKLPEFKTVKEAQKHIIANKDMIIASKKAAVKYSDPIDYSFTEKSEITKEEVKQDNFEIGSIVYPVINTTNYMDSHDDVHLNGIWNKSYKDQSGKTYFVADHELKVDKVIANPADVEILVKKLLWSDLGQKFEGETEALIFKSKITERTMPAAFEALKRKDPVQYSIRMLYVDIMLAVNNDSREYKEEYRVWKKYLPIIVNHERAEQKGYFFAIKEAKIHKEGSMVLFGSNDATPTLYSLDNKNQPAKSTEEKPSIDTLKTLLKAEIKNII